MDAMETKLFRKLDDDEKNDEFIAVESRTFLQSVWHDFTGNKRAVAGAIILIIVVLMAIFGPMMCKYSYAEQNMSLRNASPSMDHWFGTDRMGRDIFVRILFGARISLAVGCLAAVINLIVGTIYGGIAGYVGGKVDMVMMRIVDIIYSVPAMLYIVLIMLIFGASVISIMLGISITCWIDMARIVRQQVKSLKEQEFTITEYAVIERNPKTENSYRILRIPKVVMREVKHRQQLIDKRKADMGVAYKDYDYVSCQENGEPRSLTAMNQALTKICNRNGLPNITVHGLRHMFATILIELGVPLFKISGLLGHSSVHTTYEYYCEIMDEQDKIIAFVNNTFVPQRTETEG